MQIRIFFYAALFVLITCPGAGASDKTVRLHYPPERTVIEYDILNISLSIPEGAVT